MNKLVPSISLKLRNKSRRAGAVGADQRDLQARRRGRNVGRAFRLGHPARAARRRRATTELVLRSELGYTGEQPRLQMLQNKEFVDAKVEIFLKQGSRVWAKLAEFPIDRQLLTQ